MKDAFSNFCVTKGVPKIPWSNYILPNNLLKNHNFTGVATTFSTEST